MNHLPLIIKREYLTKVRNKSFIIMTVLSPILMIALFALVAYLSQLNNSRERIISILDESGLVSDVFEDSETTKYHKLDQMSLEAAKTLVEETEEYGLLHIEGENGLNEISKSIKFYSKDTPSLTLIASIEGKLEKKLTDLKLQEDGVDIEK